MLVVRGASIACLVSLGAFAAPGAWLWRAIRDRTWNVRFLLLMPAAVGIAFVTFQWALQTQQPLASLAQMPAVLALFAQATMGLPLLALAASIAGCTIRRRWRPLAWLAVSIVALSLAWGASILWIDSRDMDPAQRYTWDGWPFAGVVGAYFCGVLCLAWWFVGEPLLAGWRWLRSERQARPSSNLKPQT
ncbi:MAG TPA: hypothetical protein VGX78_00220 [Pirellulales bacterium]|jgi:hypothetical protein|nr:hypothetical protein [Pirellulales bacterium]